MANGLIVNEAILRLTGELLILPDYHRVVSIMNVFDIELLLDFILHVCIMVFLSPAWRHCLLSEATTQQ